MKTRDRQLLPSSRENGAGKSTLIRLLTGAERPDAGTIKIGGETHTGLTPALGHALGIGVIY
jgi:ABC-type sugar transport system ATPase subunit